MMLRLPVRTVRLHRRIRRVTFNIFDNDSDVDMKDLINENPSGDSITISAVTGAQNGSVIV